MYTAMDRSGARVNRSEEHDLIRKAAAGDKAAAELFVRAYQNQLFSYLVRMCGKPDIAEDIVQDAFVRVLSNLDRFDPRFRFSTWLFTIARRLYLNAAQKSKPSYNTDVVDARAGRSATPECLATEADSDATVKDELQRALLCLSTEQREVLVLFHQQNWPIWLIAQHLGMPEGTIKSHLHRGRRRLREALSSHDDSSRHIAEVWT